MLQSTKPLFQPGNTKLGHAFRSFSLPIVETCLSPTEVCKKVCYGKRGRLVMSSCRGSQDRSLKRAKSRTFAAEAAAEIREYGSPAVRVHVVGDFFSPAYADAWSSVARNCPKSDLLIYTRRWLDPSMWPSLGRLGSLPNVHLWCSCDSSSGEPPAFDWKAGNAYLSLSDEDVPAYPAGVVFRNRPKTEMKFTKFGDFVCPAEQGVKRKKKITCSDCRYCLSDKLVTRRDPEAPVPRRVPLMVVTA